VKGNRVLNRVSNFHLLTELNRGVEEQGWLLWCDLGGSTVLWSGMECFWLWLQVGHTWM